MIHRSPIAASVLFITLLVMCASAFVAYRLHELSVWLETSDQHSTEFTPASPTQDDRRTVPSSRFRSPQSPPAKPLPAGLLAPEPIHYLPAGAITPVQSAIPRWKWVSTKSGVTLSSSWPWVDGDDFRHVDFSFDTPDQELKNFAFVERNGVVIVVLVSNSVFEVHLRAPDGTKVAAPLVFDNHQSWTDPISHLEYLNGRLALRGSLDEVPWNVSQRWLRIFEVATGKLILEQDASPELSALPPWQWPQSSPDRVSRCRGESGQVEMTGSGGKTFTVPTCSGELSQRVFTNRLTAQNDPRVELQITRQWDAAIGSATCAATLRPPVGTDVRLLHEEAGVIVFGRTEDTLYTWQYDLDCSLLGSRKLPASVLHAGFRTPLPPGSQVRFETEPKVCPADRDCTLVVTDSVSGRTSGHNLVVPRGVDITGYDDDYIWWAYANDSDWYVYVVDRDTREIVLGEMASHSEQISPVAGLAVEDGRLTVHIGHFLAMGRLPEYEARVYAVDSGALVAREWHRAPSRVE